MTESLVQHLGALYSALDDPDRLNEFLVKAVTLYSACNVGYGWVDRISGARAYVGTNIPLEHRHLYLPNVEQDPWVKAGVKRARLPAAIRGSDLVTQREYRRSWFYRDIYRPANIEHMLCTASLRADRTAFLVVNRSAVAGNFEEADVLSLAPIAPHIVRFTDLLAQNRFLKVLPTDFPVIETTDRGILWMNQRAEEILKGHPDISVADNKLKLRDRDRSRILTDTISLFSKPPEHAGSKRGLCIPLAVPGGRLLVLPSSRVAADFRREYQATILMFGPESTDLKKFFNRYQITPREAELAVALFNGSTLREFAEYRHRSIHTVRTQLKSLQLKTGCPSTVALVRKLMNNAAPSSN